MGLWKVQTHVGPCTDQDGKLYMKVRNIKKKLVCSGEQNSSVLLLDIAKTLNINY